VPKKSSGTVGYFAILAKIAFFGEKLKNAPFLVPLPAYT
jgi:hypothetical protein